MGQKRGKRCKKRSKKDGVRKEVGRKERRNGGSRKDELGNSKERKRIEKMGERERKWSKKNSGRKLQRIK